MRHPVSGYTGCSILCFRHEPWEVVRRHPVVLHMLQASFLARVELLQSQERTQGKTSLSEGEKIRKVFFLFQRYIPYFSLKDSTLLIWAFFLEQAPFNHFHQEGKSWVQPFLNITYGLFKKEMKIKKKIYRMALISIALYESLKGAINATPPWAAQKSSRMF